MVNKGHCDMCLVYLTNLALWMVVINPLASLLNDDDDDRFGDRHRKHHNESISTKKLHNFASTTNLI